MWPIKTTQRVPIHRHCKYGWMLSSFIAPVGSKEAFNWLWTLSWLIHFKKHKICCIFYYSQRWGGTGFWNVSSQQTPARSSCKLDTVAHYVQDARGQGISSQRYWNFTRILFTCLQFSGMMHGYHETNVLVIIWLRKNLFMSWIDR